MHPNTHGERSSGPARRVLALLLVFVGLGMVTLSAVALPWVTADGGPYRAEANIDRADIALSYSNFPAGFHPGVNAATVAFIQWGVFAAAAVVGATAILAACHVIPWVVTAIVAGVGAAWAIATLADLNSLLSNAGMTPGIHLTWLGFVVACGCALGGAFWAGPRRT